VYTTTIPSSEGAVSNLTISFLIAIKVLPAVQYNICYRIQKEG
jgi:hypothetical protein